ncbi:MAG: hypothetical protein A2Z12_05535 [Actinobacteria bacterium RBG_16_68_21]|nr:MAG: hypothetical protein A2Z12_05535 [Actinobacteria bacterium RBG_16_68_21]
MATRRWLTAIVALLLIASACGDDSVAPTTTDGESSTAATTTEATSSTAAASSTAATTTTTATPPEVEDPIDLDDLTLYDEPADTSYRVTLFFHFRAETDAGTVDGTQLVDGGKLLDPVRFELTGQAEGDATGPQCFEFHNLPGFVDPYEVYLNDGGFLTGEASLLAEGLGVNDRLVDRYAITMDNIDPTDPAGSEVDELTEAYLDIDREGRFVVQLVLNGRGRSALLTGQPSLIGDVDYALNFSEFGTVQTLQAPVGC